MFFIPNFLRRSFPGHALGQSSLTLFLLSSALGFLVSSYTIDDSCRNYKGNDISGDIARAIQEAQLLASNALATGISEAANANSLLVSLFGTDREKHAAVVNHFAMLSLEGFNKDFVVICDDLHVVVEPDSFYDAQSDPLGVWVDRRYSWTVGFNDFIPCNPARKPGATIGPQRSYIIARRLIYLCPSILDNSRGRTLEPYKNELVIGYFIDDFMLLPGILLNDLLYIHLPNLVVAAVRDFPPASVFEDTGLNLYDPEYLSSLPMVSALGFPLCEKLGKDNPNAAVHNCYSVAVWALGAYLSKNDWNSYLMPGFASRPLSG